MLDLARDTIFVTLAGSHAHGTAHDGSDIDLRGVCIAPLSTRLSLFRGFEQFEGSLAGSLWEQVRAQLVRHPAARRSLAGKVESVLYDVAKFLGLCAAANPNALEILFADPRDWLYETPIWSRIHAERARFLTKKVQLTYLGYALAQLKKIQTHRSWLLTPPAHPPTREEFGLPGATTLQRDDQDRIERAVSERMRSYGIDTLEMPKVTRIALTERMQSFWRDALSVQPEQLEQALREVVTGALQLPDGVVRALEAERKYRAAVKHWDAYQAWKTQRNPQRAELERRYGYDTKHAMHLLRLMHTGLEVLQEGELRVRRPDAAELLAVRAGELTFEQLSARANELQAEMRAAALSSRLPDDVDYSFVDGLALQVIGEN
jgi:uncharacterized protein